jgi:hypothetical protein
MRVVIPAGLSEEETTTYVGVFRGAYLDTKNPGRREPDLVRADFEAHPVAYLAGESAAINERPVRNRRH